MIYYKKQSFGLIFLFNLIVFCISAVDNSGEYKNFNEAKSSINSSLGGAFAFGNQNRVNLDGKDLNQAFDKLSLFVKKAANGDKDLLNPLTKVEDAHNSIINTIKIVDRSYLSKIPLSLDNINKAEKEFSKLKTVNSNLLSVQKDLLKVIFIRSAKKEARDLLNIYINGLMALITRAGSNLNAEKASISQPNPSGKVPLVQQSYPAEVYKKLGIDKNSTVYNLFGLKNNASPAEVNSAYKKLSVKWHPDKNSDKLAGEIFKLISSAKNCIIEGNANSANASCRVN